jgi:hypothetical protein
MIIDEWVDISEKYTILNRKLDDVIHCLTVWVIDDKLPKGNSLRIRTRWNYTDDNISVKLIITKDGLHHRETYNYFKIPHDVVNTAAINDGFMRNSVETMKSIDDMNSDLWLELNDILKHINKE